MQFALCNLYSAMPTMTLYYDQKISDILVIVPFTMTKMFFRSTTVVIVLCQCCTMLLYLLILLFQCVARGFSVLVNPLNLCCYFYVLAGTGGPDPASRNCRWR